MKDRQSNALTLKQCQAVVQAADIALVHVLTDGIVFFLNRYAEELLGRNSKEIVGKRVVSLVPDVPPGSVESEMARVLGEGSSHYYETPVRTRSGSHRWVLWKLAPMVDSDGKPVGVVWAGMDITRRRKAEETLRECAETYSDLFECACDAILVESLDGDILAVNRRACELLGYGKEELLSQNITNFIPSGLDKRALHEGVRDRLIVMTETQVKDRSGTWIDVEFSVRLVELKDREVLFVHVRDIRQRKQAEQDRLEIERRLNEAKNMFYKKTILAATDGKLEIVDASRMDDAIGGAEFDQELSDAVQFSPIRLGVSDYCKRHGLGGQRLEEFILGVGEAMTNALKHAGCGRVLAGFDEDLVWVAVADCGPGIDALILPTATLQRYFSTKPSMGLGFTIILDVTDHVKLSTGPKGTTVLMEEFLVAPIEVSLLNIISETL